jgi:phosphoribosylanthranilate isomerase
MPLKTLVKAGNISNLNEARYCAGMGVDLLGFRVIEGKPDYVSPKLFQEIRGWISGPEIVAEVQGLESVEQLSAVIRDYAPNYIELTDSEYALHAAGLTLPCIVDITTSESIKSLNKTDGIAYFVVDDASRVRINSSPFLLKINSTTNLLEKIKLPSVAGIALNGSGETKSGVKDYDELADILELLDE